MLDQDLQIFRWLLVLVLVLNLAISGYHRGRARSEETIARGLSSTLTTAKATDSGERSATGSGRHVGGSGTGVRLSDRNAQAPEASAVTDSSAHTPPQNQ